jgi:putative ABC transport system ATP-binding protein
LLKDPDILILDEATSALDAESETLVNQAVGVLLKGHNTTISIAHRLSTIKRSDRIIVIGSDGTVEEEGSYAELSNNKEGAFTRLMEWQLSGESGPEAPKRSPIPTEEEEIEFDLEEGEDAEDRSKVREAVAEHVKGGNR